MLGLILSLIIVAPANAGRFTQLIRDAANATRPGPAPNPNPPSDICDECGGDGELGDGTVKLTCPVCKGTGKKTTAEATPFGGFTDADQQPTPLTSVAAGLAALQPKPNEVLVDYGCGRDARWLTHAVSFYGTKKAIGVEIDPQAAESARRHVAEAGLSDRITIITGDATQENVQADIGVAYLWPETLAKLKPKIEKLKRFVTFSHAVPGLTMQKRGDLFVYSKPAPVVVQEAAPVVMQEIQSMPIFNYQPSTVYRGRSYSRPVCNSPNCAMCNAIRRGLWR